MATSKAQIQKSTATLAPAGEGATATLTAGQRLCDVTELLEAILYELPTRDLLFAQKVNKQWKAVIEGSIKLQHALFYIPLPGDDIPFSTRRQYHAVKSPLLKPILDALLNVEQPHGRLNLMRLLFNKDSYCHIHPSWTYEHASWRDMFSTQPPMESPIYVHTINDHEEDPEYEDSDSEYGGEGPETIRHARCSANKLTISELVLGLHVLGEKIWEPSAFTSMNESEPFRGAEDLHSNQQLQEIMRLRASGEIVRAVPGKKRGSRGHVSDSDWKFYDSDYESDDEMGHFLATGERLTEDEDEEMGSEDGSVHDDYEGEDESEDGYGSRSEEMEDEE